MVDCHDQTRHPCLDRGLGRRSRHRKAFRAANAVHIVFDDTGLSALSCYGAPSMAGQATRYPLSSEMCDSRGGGLWHTSVRV
jgi:hypothetical protein